jgi:predicted metal-dependent peptidase
MAGPDPIIDEITLARTSLLFEAPFFGNLALHLRLVDASRWCKTAATDGRNLYYNRDFIKGLSRKQLVFLVCHELLHCVYDHFGRRGDRDPGLYNMASDYIVNYTIVKEGIGEMPKVGLYNEKFTDKMTSEEVYDILKQNSTTIKMTLDEHLDLECGGEEDKKDGSGKTIEVTVMNPDPTGKDGPPKLTKEELEEIRNQMRANLINASQCGGHVPAGIRRLIDELVEPQMNWRALLTEHIQSTIKDDYTFIRPNKRSWGLGVILPGMSVMDTIDIEVFIDCSGSMTNEMLRDFLTEVKGIMQTFPDFRIHLSTFDTKVYNRQLFTPENIDDIDDYDAEGGGGTSFDCCWTFMKNEEIQPMRCVFFTDGFTGDGWGDPDWCPTLFIIYGHNSVEAPHGITARYTSLNSTN